LHADACERAPPCKALCKKAAARDGSTCRTQTITLPPLPEEGCEIRRNVRKDGA
jgi:hypothetical protein